jgi:hypothetical protein
MLIGTPDAGERTLPAVLSSGAIGPFETLLVMTSLDAPDPSVGFDVLKKSFAPRFAVVSAEAPAERGLETLRAATYHYLGKAIRVVNCLIVGRGPIR